MRNLFDFVDAVISDGTATYSLVTGQGHEHGFVVYDDKSTDVIALFGNETTRMILVHSFVKQFISTNGVVLSDARYSLHGRYINNQFALSVCMVYDSRKVAERNALLNYYDIFNNETIEV